MEALWHEPSARALESILSDVDTRGPGKRTIERIVYNGQLMTHSTAFKILRAMRCYAEKNHTSSSDELFDPRVALIEFDTSLPELGVTIGRAAGSSSAEHDFVSDIASASGVSPQVIMAAAQNRSSLLPKAVAERIAVAAMQVLRLSEPLQTRKVDLNETTLKPIGAAEVDQGLAAHSSRETHALREAVILANRQMAA